MTKEVRESRANRFFQVIGRVKSGVTVEQAKADLDLLSRQIEQQSPESNTNLIFNAVSMHEDITRDYRSALLVLLGAVGLVLLVACANVANLLLARAATRQKEVAIRMALGATARDIFKLVVGRGMKLTAFGVLLGVAGAAALTRLMHSLLFNTSSTDPVTFILISLLLSLAAFLACYIPARRAAKVDPLVALRYE